MSFITKLLYNQRDEYQTLLDLVNEQLEDGTVFKTPLEVESAQNSKANYEDILRGINDAIGSVGT
ncbi:hypothetical protein D3C72_1618720 [compost metagenome]